MHGEVMADIILTEEQIKALIHVPKKIVQAPSKEERKERQCFRNDMRLLSLDGQYSFKVYFRRHAIFIENFSIGLVYNPSELKGEVTLFRCNGTHGPTRLWDHHNSPHTHRVTEQDLLEDRKSESDITPTKAYNTYEQAVFFFAKECHIFENCPYIDKFKQLTLTPPPPCIQNNS